MNIATFLAALSQGVSLGEVIIFITIIIMYVKQHK